MRLLARSTARTRGSRVPAKKTKKKTAKKAVAKKSGRKKTAAKKKAPARKKPASKKPTAKKKAPAKKRPAKRSAAKKKPAAKRKAPARKKPASKKAVAKKPAAKKKAAAKKSAPRRAAVKKSPAKKSAPKKTPTKRSAAKKVSAKKAPKKKATRSSRLAGTPELDQVARKLASLAIAKDESPLSVRQLEQLRRALAAAGEELGWIENPSGNGASIAEFSTDLIAMARNGAKSLGQDLAEELANKKTEITRLNKVIEHTRELAEDPDTVYPVDILFDHTIRDAYQEYVTKSETKVVNDGDEARSAAASIERSLTSWTKLADAMIVDLKRRQKQLSHVTEGLPEFVESSHGLLRAVVANLW